MNERFWELAKRADVLIDYGDDITVGRYSIGVSTEKMKKFAELIVKECVQTLRDNTPVLDENESVEDWNKGYIRAMLDCEHHITEHFGIK